MKRNILIVITVLLIISASINIYLMITNNKVENLYNKTISEVNNYFKMFYKNNSTYNIKNIDINSLSSQGAEIKAYFNDDKLVYIKAYSYGELGKVETDYYMINDEVTYVIDKEYEYDTIFYNNPNIKQESIKEYFIVRNDVMKYDNETDNLIIDLENKNIINQIEVIKSEIK